MIDREAAAKAAFEAWLALPDDIKSQERPYIHGWNQGWEHALHWNCIEEDGNPEFPGTYLAIRDVAHMVQWHFGHWNGTQWRSGDRGDAITPTHWKHLGPSPSGDWTIESEFTLPDTETGS